MKISKYISEFLGTGFLFCAVVGSGIMAENLSNDNSIILFINAIVTFFALYFLITAFESFSNQFNPVVSFALFLNKEISLKIFCIFCLLQTFGAIAGVIIANIMFGMDIIEFSEKNRFGSNIFLSEIIASFGLVFFILISNKAKIPLVVASYIGAAYWFTSSTSFANPAGTIGRMFSNSFAGINPENVLYFCIAQIIGGIFAFLIYRYFFKTN